MFFSEARVNKGYNPLEKPTQRANPDTPRTLVYSIRLILITQHSVPGRVYRPNRSEFSVFFSETCLNMDQDPLERPRQRAFYLQSQVTRLTIGLKPTNNQPTNQPSKLNGDNSNSFSLLKNKIKSKSSYKLIILHTNLRILQHRNPQKFQLI